MFWSQQVVNTFVSLKEENLYNIYSKKPILGPKMFVISRGSTAITGIIKQYDFQTAAINNAQFL